MMPIVIKFFFLKTLEALLPGWVVWLYVSPIASLQETVFLTSVAVMVWLLYAFRQWQKRGVVAYRSAKELWGKEALEKDGDHFEVWLFAGVLLGGFEWSDSYSELPTGGLIFSTSLFIMFGIWVGVFVEKTIRKKYSKQGEKKR